MPFSPHLHHYSPYVGVVLNYHLVDIFPVHPVLQRYLLGNPHTELHHSPESTLACTRWRELLCLTQLHSIRLNPAANAGRRDLKMRR